jgi:hypothetical protein
VDGRQGSAAATHFRPDLATNWRLIWLAGLAYQAQMACCAGFSVRQVGSQRNGQERVEALVPLLLEPVGRRQRQTVLALLDT